MPSLRLSNTTVEKSLIALERITLVALISINLSIYTVKTMQCYFIYYVFLCMFYVFSISECVSLILFLNCFFFSDLKNNKKLKPIKILLQYRIGKSSNTIKTLCTTRYFYFTNEGLTS